MNILLCTSHEYPMINTRINDAKGLSGLRQTLCKSDICEIPAESSGINRDA